MNDTLTGQWADALLQVERLHLLKLSLWGALSVLVGTAVFAIQRLRRAESSLLKHFAVQSIAWGAVDLAIAAWAHRGLALRDLEAAVALDRFVWLNVGLDVGYVAVGATLATFGLRAPQRAGLAGAGIGVIVQGLALLVLDLQLAAGIVR